MHEPVPLDSVPAPLLRLDVTRRRTATTLVEASGELDLTTARAFADTLSGAISASPGRRVIVDLTRCTFFAARGAGVLHRARTTARRRRVSLHVVVGGPAATTIARTVRLGAGLRPHHTVRAAEAARGGRVHRPPPYRAVAADTLRCAVPPRIPAGRPGAAATSTSSAGTPRGVRPPPSADSTGTRGELVAPTARMGHH